MQIAENHFVLTEFWGMRKLLVFVFTIAVCRMAVAAPSIDVLSDADESLYTQIFILQDAE